MRGVQGGSSVVLFAVLALIGLGVGFWALVLADDRFKPEITVVEAEPRSQVAVAVEGAIVNPGVYRLPEGARIADLIDVAGGAREDSDLASMNLSQLLTDGEIVSIPVVALSTPTSSTEGTDAAINPAMGFAATDARLNINTASEEELDGLPGIGPALAQEIVAERERIGGFSSVDELELISGISMRMVDEFRHLITV